MTAWRLESNGVFFHAVLKFYNTSSESELTKSAKSEHFYQCASNALLDFFVGVWTKSLFFHLPEEILTWRRDVLLVLKLCSFAAETLGYHCDFTPCPSCSFARFSGESFVSSQTSTHPRSSPYGKPSKQSKRPCLNDLRLQLFFHPCRRISALALVYFHSDTAWRSFKGETVRRGRRDGSSRKAFVPFCLLSVW